MIRYNEPLQVYPIEVLRHIHPLADKLNNVLLADMDKTSDQQKIQAEANHLIILPKDDQQGSHLQINMVSDLPPISLASEQMRIPLLTDMDKTNDQQKIQAEANHLVILPKDDQQGNNLRINMVSALRQIHQISLTGDRNHIHPLADLLIDMDNTNDLCKKEIKDRQHSNLLIQPTDMVNTNGRYRNQDQDRQRNQTKTLFLILIPKIYQRISLLIITINMFPIKTNIANFP